MTLAERLLQATRAELARTLAELCADVTADEASILLPVGDGELVFFASSNPALMQPGVVAVPINASFSGLAFRTGQTIAVADAAHQERHYGAVDELVGKQTREFAAIPISGRTTLGILTLASRPEGAALGPFTLPELRRAEQKAGELAAPIAILSGLAHPHAAPDGASPADPELMAALAQLHHAELRIVHSLAVSLLQNREG